MTEVQLRTHVGDLLAAYGAAKSVELIGPNETSNNGFPAVTGNVEDPSLLVVWEFGDEEPTNENGWQSTFGGTEIWRGRLNVAVFVEKDVGDQKQREHIRDLRKTYLTPSAANTSNFYVGASRIADEYDSDAGFVAREVQWTYIRIDEP